MRTVLVHYDGTNGEPIWLDRQRITKGVNRVREGMARLILARPNSGFTRVNEPSAEPTQKENDNA